MSPADIERLKFLKRIFSKEIFNLQYSSQQVFGDGQFDVKILSIENNCAFAQTLEAYTSRFCRLQDTVGDKLLPACLAALQEPTKAAIDNLDKAEKLCFLNSVEEWIQVRQLRNKMAQAYEVNLIAFANNMLSYLYDKKIV